MRECTKCKRLLSEDDFNWKIRGQQRAYYCKECSRHYIREHYLNNREYYLKKAKERKQINRLRSFEFLADYLKKHPCVDCGEKDILVLEFDHKETAEKDSDVSQMVKNACSLDKLAVEIAKCDVRCANCHRRKTNRESLSWRLDYAPVA